MDSNVHVADRPWFATQPTEFAKSSTSVTFPAIRPTKLQPAVSPSVHLGLTVVYTVLYGALFFIVYIQLWMILYYRHKRFSYQTVFLFLCLVWAGLRTTLFSFYFHNCTLANNLDIFSYWLLYCFPVCLQFITLCLLVLFFGQVVFKSRTKYESNRYKIVLMVCICLAVLAFLATNITCAVIAKSHEENAISPPLIVLMIRVVINDALFVVMGIILAVYIYKLAKMTSVNLVLEARGTTICQAMTACVLIILVYTSRAVYNMIAVAQRGNQGQIPSFGFNWINVSDQADLSSLERGYSYISFGVVLFVWEFLPTFVVVLFFRVKRPTIAGDIGEISSRSINTKAYFFDNPRRYDSDDDLPRSASAEGVSPYTINPQMGPRHQQLFGSYTSGQYSFPTNTPPTGGASVNQPHFYDGT